MSRARALITGITGQDGSYLTDLLLAKGYEVHGLVRRTSTLERSRLNHHYHNPEVHNQSLFLHYAELDDPTTLRRMVEKAAPDELYHLAGQSHVGLSFKIPEATADMTAIGTLRLLEMMRDLPNPPRFYHASSSEIFGRPEKTPQDESTPHAPVNPYGVAKSFATHMTRVYRETHGLFACNGIAYNHESPRRGENFVTRKICRAAAAIKAGRQKELLLGDTSAERDWGDARDTVRGMWLALQQDAADDYIFATGKLHTVQDIVDIAFASVELNAGDYIKRDQRFMRPTEPTRLLGKAARAKEQLGWEAETSFEDLIREMTEVELKALGEC